jgi:hypothetical protein
MASYSVILFVLSQAWAMPLLSRDFLRTRLFHFMSFKFAFSGIGDPISVDHQV